MTMTTAGEALTQLERLGASEHYVTTAYLRLGPTERVPDRLRPELKNAVKRAHTEFAAGKPTHDQREAVERDLGRVLALSGPPSLLPEAPAIAVFACQPLGLFEVVSLPRVHRTRVVIAHRPAIDELVAVTSEFGRLLVVLADRTHVRLFEATAFGAAELTDIFSLGARGGKYHSDRADAPGWGERDYHNRLEHERSRRYALVTDALRKLLHETPVQGLVLAGPHDETSALRRFLPPALAAAVIGTSALNPTSATLAEVRMAALAHRDAQERAMERAVLAEVTEGVGTGWAANGTHHVLRALARGQVRTLVIPAGVQAAGFRCAASERLVLDQRECAGEGPAVPVDDLFNEVITEALRQRVDVLTVDDPASAVQVDGMAAVLRFRVE